jgi:hypothetical protein
MPFGLLGAANNFATRTSRPKFRRMVNVRVRSRDSGSGFSVKCLDFRFRLEAEAVHFGRACEA